MKVALRLAALLLAASLAGAGAARATGSRCFGTPADGRLEGGVSLPLNGENFTAYSTAGWTLGRTYVHATVQQVLVDAFRRLETAARGAVFVYGETGWKGAAASGRTARTRTGCRWT